MTMEHLVTDKEMFKYKLTEHIVDLLFCRLNACLTEVPILILGCNVQTI